MSLRSEVRRAVGMLETGYAANTLGAGTGREAINVLRAALRGGRWIDPAKIVRPTIVKTSAQIAQEPKPVSPRNQRRAEKRAAWKRAHKKGGEQGEEGVRNPKV